MTWTQYKLNNLDSDLTPLDLGVQVKTSSTVGVHQFIISSFIYVIVSSKLGTPLPQKHNN